MEALDAAEDASGGCRILPDWLEARLVPDSRFARAYDSLGDSGRGLLKRLIAAHYALNPPAAALSSTRLDVLRGGLCVATDAAPRAWAVILCDGGLDAPAFLLPALVPALCSGISDVLVVRLGAGKAVAGSTLAACELAGQERVAALGAAQAQELLAHLAGCALPGVLLHADTPALRALLARPALADVLASQDIWRAALPMPTRCALWRDAPEDFPAETLGQLFGSLPFAEPEAGQDFETFAAAARDLLLIPDGRMAQLFQLEEPGARVVASQSQLGLWPWRQISPESFLTRTSIFSSDR